MSSTMDPTSWQAIMSYLQGKGQNTNQLQDYSKNIRDWFQNYGVHQSYQDAMAEGAYSHTNEALNDWFNDWGRFGIANPLTPGGASTYKPNDVKWDQIKTFLSSQGVTDSNPYSISKVFKEYGLMPDDAPLPALVETPVTTSDTTNTSSTNNSDGNIDLTGSVTINPSSGPDPNMGPHQEVTDTNTGGGVGGGGGLTESDVQKMFDARMKELFSNNWTPYGYGWGGSNTGGVAINRSNASKMGGPYAGNKSSFGRQGYRLATTPQGSNSY